MTPLRCLESSFNANEVPHDQRPLHDQRPFEEEWPLHDRSSTPAFEIVHSGMIIGPEMEFSIGFCEDRKVVFLGHIIDPSFFFDTYQN